MLRLACIAVTNSPPTTERPDATSNADATRAGRSNTPERTSSEASPADALYRQEALDHHAGASKHSTILELTPRWVNGVSLLLAAISIVGGVFMVFGRINEYAEGVALVHTEDRTDVTARFRGTVESVTAYSGQEVAAGQVLVTLYAADALVELSRVNREFELELTKMLRDPTDEGARASLISLRTQRERAQAQVEQHLVRAPHSGLVSDIRIRPGQTLEVGELVMSLTEREPTFHLIALMPGQYRPYLRPGMSLRLEMRGYPFAYQSARIERVGEEVIGPAEVRRFLRQTNVDSFDVPGPVVLVEASLPSAGFLVDGDWLPYFDGMQGRVEAAVRSESLLTVLIPGLRRVLEGDGDPR